MNLCELITSLIVIIIIIYKNNPEMEQQYIPNQNIPLQ